MALVEPIKPIPRHERGLVVAWSRVPFEAGKPERKFLPISTGDREPTLQEVVDGINADRLPVEFGARGQICVDGQIVPRELWSYVRPRLTAARRQAGITLHVQLGKGGNFFQILAAVALIVVTTFITGGGLAAGGFFAAGSISAAVAAGGVSRGGQISIGVLS